MTYKKIYISIGEGYTPPFISKPTPPFEKYFISPTPHQHSPPPPSHPYQLPHPYPLTPMNWSHLHPYQLRPTSSTSWWAGRVQIPP